MKEILWLGRGGQGAFTAAKLFGAAYIQGHERQYALAFPSFGPERRGAPVRAFTKLDESPVLDRSQTEQADFIVVLDDTLYAPDLQTQLQETIKGASLDAADWAGGVLRGQVKNRVEESLPDFKAAVDLTTKNGNASVQVIIYPVGELVRNVQYSMISRSLPNILLMKLKYKYADKAKSLQGLPVSYLKENRDILARRLLEELAEEPQVRRHHLIPRVTIHPGPETQVDFFLESNEYKIWFEGYADIGRDDHNLSGRAHLGKFISRRDEIFGEAGIDLKDVRWDFSGGYAFHYGKSTLSYMYRVPSDSHVIRAEYDFTPKWRLRYEHFGDTGDNEYAIRYRIHEFLSGEYVYSTEKSYFRIVGNL